MADISIDNIVLGADFFRLNRVWISYSRETLFIQPANHLMHDKIR